MSKNKFNITQYEIIQVASELFFKEGYTKTSPKMIAEELNISTGNITYYFPTKEHLLLELVQRLCDFQWYLLNVESNMGIGSISSICLEFMTVASACDSSEIARDFFTATYQSELCRTYLRENHIERAKVIFKEQCASWTNEQFVESEVLIMGIVYGTISAYNTDLSLSTRIKGAINLILSLYNIDKDIIDIEVNKVLEMDCKTLGKKVLNEFIKFIEQENNKVLNTILNRRIK